MTTLLSIHGYGIPKQNNEELIAELKKDLTMSPNINFTLSSDAEQFEIFKESEKRLYIPRYYGLQKFGIPDKISLHEGKDCPALVFQGTLRDQQLEPVENFIKAANNPLKRGGIISVPCGFGKTIMSVYIACVFKKKTMFVSHKDFLNQQFSNTVKEFVPDAKIGIIKQSKIQVENKDFVIASLQSLAIRDYDIDIFKDFGLIIIDEVHHLGAEVFSRAFAKMNAPIILGLSATLNRKDGMRKVFEYFIGKSVFKFAKKEHIEMNVEMHKYFNTDTSYSANKLLWNGKPNSAGMINNICAFTPRNEFIIELVQQILQKECNRKILILSERRAQLNIFETMLKTKGYESIGYYVGGLTQYDLDISATKQIILATYQMAAEGMNIPTLNTLILASPISDIQQAVGRILREKPSERKYIPLCIDIWDEFSIFVRKGYTRIKYYKSHEYNITYYVENIEMKEKKDIKYKFIPDD